MRFLKIQMVAFATVILCIILASGTLIANKEAWKGLGLLAIVAVVLAVAGLILVGVFTSPAMSTKQAAPIAITVVLLGFGAIVLMMGFGREWLSTLIEPFKTAGLWWPIVTFIGGSISYGLAQSNDDENTEPTPATELDSLL